MLEEVRGRLGGVKNESSSEAEIGCDACNFRKRRCLCSSSCFSFWVDSSQACHSKAARSAALPSKACSLNPQRCSLKVLSLRPQPGGNEYVSPSSLLRKGSWIELARHHLYISSPRLITSKSPWGSTALHFLFVTFCVPAARFCSSCEPQL